MNRYGEYSCIYSAFGVSNRCMFCDQRMIFQTEDFLPERLCQAIGLTFLRGAMELYGRLIAGCLRAYCRCGGKIVEVSVTPDAVSKAVGYHGENREKSKKDFGIKNLKIVEKNGLMLYNILLRVYE